MENMETYMDVLACTGITVLTLGLIAVVFKMVSTLFEKD